MSTDRFSVSVDEKTSNEIQNIVNKTGKSKAEVTRELINKGLAANWLDENVDFISQIIRRQLEVVIKPHIERLAKLSSKCGHIAATAAFLNVQAFQDLVMDEKRKVPIEMYEKARKKAVEYMKMPVDEFNEREGI